MNSRGALGDMLMFFPFVFLMGIIAGGIVIGTLFFVGSGYDFRADDASLLGAKIDSCVSEGFDLDNLKGKSDTTLLSEECEFNKEVLEDYYKIKICERDKVMNASDCVASSTFVFSFGGVQPCEFRDSNKFLGCSARVTNDYIIVIGTNQKLRRNAK